jgi:hypothetical protein
MGMLVHRSEQRPCSVARSGYETKHELAAQDNNVLHRAPLPLTPSDAVRQGTWTKVDFSSRYPAVEGLAPPNSAGFCKIPAERMLPSPSKVGLYELESTIVPLPFGVMAHPLFRTRLTTGHWLLGEPPTARGVKRIEVRASFGVLGRLPQGNNYSLCCLLLQFVACYCIISRVQV